MRIAVGLSGGVDSAVAAALLKERGDEVVGVTMALGRPDETENIRAARATADRLAIPFHVFDLAEAWRSEVLDAIRAAYRAGETPNPCVLCNERVKFGLLPRLALGLGCDRFATGHYARLETAPGGEPMLLRGTDRFKDQSYFLYRADKAILARTLFPLGGLTKGEVRERAKALGLAVAERSDSQDFCLGDPLALVGAEAREGCFVDRNGRELGRHRGFWNFTVGKRKGIGIGGGTPFYVLALDAERNEVVIGPRDEAVVRRFEIGSVVRLAEKIEGPLAVKVRSAGEPKGPVLWEGGEEVRCPEGLWGVAPGQSAVFYAGERIVGGGIIRGSY